MLRKKKEELIDATSGARLAQIEFNSLTGIAWPLLAIYYWFSALFAEEYFKTWQAIYLIGLGTSYLGTIILGRLGIATYKFLPIMFFMLAAPIALGDTPSTPWMSFGLVSLAAVLSLSNLVNAQISIISMIAICVIQIWAIRSDLTSINDKRDLLLLNSFFSTLWTFGVGLSVLIIRKKYLAKSAEIDNDIEIIESQTMQTFAQVNRLNRSDSKNLQLHGTILNTLIYATQNLSFQRDRNAFRGQLLTELERFENSNTNESILLSIRELIESLRKPNLVIHLENLNILTTDLKVRDELIEIIRELLLNVIKHTSSTIISLSIIESTDHKLHISLRDNSTIIMDRNSGRSFAEMGYHSYSLNRLLNMVNGELKISLNDQNETVKEVVIPTMIEIQSIRKTLNAKRLESLQYLSRSLIGAVIIYTILCIPGYLYLNSDLRVIAILLLELSMLILNYFKKITPDILRYFSISVSLSVFPVIAAFENTCQELLITPWVYNSLLGSVFYFALVAKNRYERWFPLAIYFAQSVFIPYSFPSECQGLLIGSLPGVPLIVLFAILIFRIRDRASQQDETRLLSTFNDQIRLEELEKKLATDRQSLLNFVRQFAESLVNYNYSSESLANYIRYVIYRLRNFLICSEFYESAFVRDLYHVVDKESRPGRVLSVKLYGSSFPNESLAEELDNIRERIRSATSDLEIAIFNQAGLDITFNSSLV